MIRPATPDDAPALGAIWNRVIRETTSIFNATERSEAEIAQIIGNGDPFFVWDEDGVQGFARWFPFRGTDGYRHTVEHTILLAPGLHGRGAGRAMMGRLFETARAADKHVMVACVTAENTAGIAFHERMGFERSGYMPQVGRKFGRWLDLAILQKRL
ncbi:GNAT family N-acetyltransferase [Limimaricola cinnabarinus]|jgi:phosphinothricin acetyltransferase|uniref:GNAT family N-acetyltransferase n=1 Tax=Limimaricola cinnabarinus TaxID=1125964 RepID=A0A2G1MJ91_9RHOB|nr:GNAT family N-acetyltransferase [Limimaricola cinnabarinus]PHP28826.1 GNAT family N-acetyltransferase [Limimaricola cinnabarinus]